MSEQTKSVVTQAYDNFRTGNIETLLNLLSDELLTALVPTVVGDECALGHKLADAILDESKLEALEDEPIWKAVEPIPVGVTEAG